jgi:hypothetical protein
LLVIGRTRFLEAVTGQVANENVPSFFPVIVQFSRFYGNEYGHTGRDTQEAGYNLALPKDLWYLEKFLNQVSLMRAILAQDVGRILEEIKVFNQQEGLSNPIQVIGFRPQGL